MIRFIVYFFLLIITANTVVAQRVTDSVSPGTDIIIKRAEKYNFQDKDSLGKFVSLVGKGKDQAFVQQEKILFYADSIVIDQKQNILEAFGNIHINDADSVQVYSEYLKYLGKEKK